MRWTPTIGDPSPLGWLTVLAYLLAAAVCWQASRRARARDTRFWTILSALLVALGINKQLDLQSLFTQTARDLAQWQGWYEYRQTLQTAFLAGLAAAVAVAISLSVVICRGRPRGFLISWTGATLLLGFVLARAVSFHATDRMIREKLGGLQLNHVLEIGGIGLVALGAAITWLGARQTRR